jgi:preprotein translocase subunit SecD
MLNYRLLLFVALFIFGVAFSVPSLTQSDTGKKITLGLDLQGGLHMLLGVKSEVAVESRMKSMAATLKYMLDDEEILYDELNLNDESITFELLDEDENAKTEALIQKELKGLHLTQNGLNYRLSMTEEEMVRTKENAILQAVDTIRTRLNAFGLAEPTVAKQGVDNILVEVPGIKTQAEEQRVRALIARAAHLQLMAVDEDRIARVHTMSPAEAESYGDIILPDAVTNQKYLLHKIQVLDGSMLTDAKVGFDESGQPVIHFTLNGQGAKIFGDFTEKAYPTRARMAIVLDKKVLSAPHINERIGGGRVQVSGSFTMEEAHDLAIALRSGSLLAPVFVDEKRTVGPSLGEDNIISSSIALAVGFILVIIFMIFYYHVAGVIANIALIVNLFLILAIMSLFGATLTLPGMAGIVLTVGMAVDANVIIGERIRELLREGKSVAKSIEDGYKNAFTAIWDANITTLIAAIVLYVYGTGPLKGFALTISIGILTSMVTAIVGTHGVYHWLQPKMKKEKVNFWFGIRVAKKQGVK